jgi:hypothetical protein
MCHFKVTANEKLLVKRFKICVNECLYDVVYELEIALCNINKLHLHSLWRNGINSCPFKTLLSAPSSTIQFIVV